MCNFLFISDTTRIYPEVIHVEKGKIIVIDCNSVLIPTWNFLTGAWPFNAYAHNKSLIIIQTLGLNSGVYECQGTTKDQYIFYAKSTVIVTGELTCY